MSARDYTVVPRGLVEHIREVVRYNWDDEERDYRTWLKEADAEGYDKNAHIFRTLKRIAKWIDEVSLWHAGSLLPLRLHGMPDR